MLQEQPSGGKNSKRKRVIDKFNFVTLRLRLMTLLTEIISLLDQGRNVILHGPGGVGKSYTICHLVKYYREQQNMTLASTPVTALTGVAAVVLSQSGAKARTLHSWAGIGKGEQPADTLSKLILDDPKRKGRWKAAWLLVIDEISMLSQELFDKLDRIGRTVRGIDLPFGGIRLIFSGDFLQNPPVKARFVFTSERWLATPFVWIDLTIPKRYADETWFNRLLRFRMGTHTPEDWTFLETRYDAWNKLLHQVEAGEIKVLPTMLRSTKLAAEDENIGELSKLPGNDSIYTVRYTFSPKKGGNVNRQYIIKLFEEQVPPEIRLKVGAQVMLRYNIDVDSGLVNGSRGVIVAIEPAGVEVLWVNGLKTIVGLNVWSLEDDDGIYTCTQIPLILAWAITIHKCVSGNTLISTEQGMMYMKDVSQEQGWVEKSIRVATRDGWEETSKVYKGETEESIKLTTRMGYTLEGSVRHPVLIRTSTGDEVWRKLPEIQIDDTIVLRHSFASETTPYLRTSTYYNNAPLSIINEKFGYLLGIIVGDGSYRDQKHYSVEFSNSDEDLLKIFAKTSEKLLKVRVCSYDSPKQTAKRRYFCRKEARTFLLASGMNYSKGPVKTIPWIILRSPISVQKEFIKGLFDTDGGVNKTCVHFTSSSKVLVTEVHILLLSFGIISRIAEMPNEYSGTWRIEITGENARKYIKGIGFVMKKKQNDWEKFKTTKTKIPKSNVGILPDSLDIAQKLRDSYWLSKTNGTTQFLGRVARGRTKIHVDHIPFLEEIMDLEDTDVGKMLLGIMNGTFFYDTVKIIEHSECEMYDFEVPGSHSFITNGIISHNCQASTLDCVAVDLSNLFGEGMGYVGLSRVKSEAGLFVSGMSTPNKIRASKQALAYLQTVNEAEVEKEFHELVIA